MGWMLAMFSILSVVLGVGSWWWSLQPMEDLSKAWRITLQIVFMLGGTAAIAHGVWVLLRMFG